MNLTDVLNEYGRIVMTGYPEVGKTTLAKRVADRLVIHLDDIMEEVGYEETPREALKRLARVESYLVEGTQGFRLLRFALRNELFTPPRLPLECIVFVRSGIPVLEKHFAFNKGLDTIWNQTKHMAAEIPTVDISGRLT